MNKQKSFVIEVRDLIEKIKQQDVGFGEYLQRNMILDETKDEVTYLGLPLKELPYQSLF